MFQKNKIQVIIRLGLRKIFSKFLGFFLVFQTIIKVVENFVNFDNFKCDMRRCNFPSKALAI